jgi:ubiquinone/menaquinone biosynthesis C-methylase UbiE
VTAAVLSLPPPTAAEWVIDHHLTKGLYPNFESLLVPALQGRQGARILDIASASGEPAATLAAALPQAQVLATDFVASYLEIGRARAARLGLTNVQFEVADGENLSYEDASFDAVTCSLGLMFMPSYRKALAECARVLKPGGIFAATVWHTEEHVPFFLVAREVASEYDAASTPSAGSSIAGRFGDPAELLEAISGAFGSPAACRLLDVEFSMGPGMWWRQILDTPLPIKASTQASTAVAAAAIGGAVVPAGNCCCIQPA